jgi:hypothetical protein
LVLTAVAILGAATRVFALLVSNSPGVLGAFTERFDVLHAVCKSCIFNTSCDG